MEQTVTRFLATSIAALAVALPFQAQAEPLGAHPAVIVAERGPGAYDYAAKFYPHPARLELLAHAPRAGAEHPAVLVARTWHNRGIDPNRFIPAHPARLELLAQAPHAGAEHPAVLVARTWHSRGIDPNRFIPAHPARVELLAQAPHAGAEHPAVLVARTWSNRGIDPNHFIPAHPARLEFVRADTGSDGNRPTLAHHSRP